MGNNMTETLSLATLLARSDRLHSAWQEALEPTDADDDLELSLRETIALDACALTLEHGEALRRLVAAGVQLDGASDHGVSEALYLRDPDQNGVELYWDKPEAEWPRHEDGSIAMVTGRLDLASLLDTTR